MSPYGRVLWVCNRWPRRSKAGARLRPSPRGSNWRALLACEIEAARLTATSRLFLLTKQRSRWGGAVQEAPRCSRMAAWPERVGGFGDVAMRAGHGSRLASSIARMTTIINSACRCVLVFSKTDLRYERTVSYLIPSAFAQGQSDSPVIKRTTRRASAGVKSNLFLRNAV
jgi:hypothetical protein